MTSELNVVAARQVCARVHLVASARVARPLTPDSAPELGIPYLKIFGLPSRSNNHGRRSAERGRELETLERDHQPQASGGFEFVALRIPGGRDNCYT